MKWLINLATSGALNKITDALSQAYANRLNADTEQERIEADIVINQLEAQRSVLIAEQQKWYTAWIRPMIALPIVIFIWKIVVWDTVLQLGVTPHPGGMVDWLMLTVVGAYFLMRPFEK